MYDLQETMYHMHISRRRFAWLAGVPYAAAGAEPLTAEAVIARIQGQLGGDWPGTSPDGQLVEVIELKDHPWFVAVQCHPELKSKPTAAHPLFRAFVQASLARREAKKVEARKAKPEPRVAVEER